MNKRRHDLSNNELADRLGAGIESAQSYIPWVLGGIAILAVGSIGWGLYSSSANKKAAKAWTDYYFALSSSDADAFLDIAEAQPGTKAGEWAFQTAGSGYLEKGLGNLYVNKAEGQSFINLAIQQFEKIQNTTDPNLKTKVLLGLAQAHESLGNIDEAVGYYEQLTKSTTQARLLAKASERIAFLGSPEGKEFYTWFDTLDPKPEAAIELSPELSTPPTGPGDMNFSDVDPLNIDLGDDASNAFPEVDPAGLPPATDLNLPTQDNPDALDPPEADLPDLEPAAGDPTLVPPVGSDVPALPASAGTGSN